MFPLKRHLAFLFERFAVTFAVLKKSIPWEEVIKKPKKEKYLKAHLANQDWPGLQRKLLKKRLNKLFGIMFDCGF